MKANRICASLLLILGSAMGGELLKYQSPENPAEFPLSRQSGLSATIAGYIGVQDSAIHNQKTFKLAIASFRKQVPVHAVIQPHAARLVVVLLGVDGRADGKLGKLWASWFAEAGYHVLTFDSTFLPGFVELSGQGVTGNPEAETSCVRDIIGAFLKTDEVRGKVTGIGIVGMSYGATQALLLGKMSREGKLPFEVQAVQAYSPPIDPEHTAEIVDRWFREDRWKHTLSELLLRLARSGTESLNDSESQALLGALFRMCLTDLVLRNDEAFKLHLLPVDANQDDDYMRREHAATWSFTRYMNDVVYPFWEKKLHCTKEEICKPVCLRNLLQAQPPFVEAIIAANDPFNAPEDLAELQASHAHEHLLIVPTGGHMGYVSDAWTKRHLLKLFEK